MTGYRLRLDLHCCSRVQKYLQRAIEEKKKKKKDKALSKSLFKNKGKISILKK